MLSCLALKAIFGWILKGKVLASITKAMTIHEREVAQKLTVLVLNAWGQGFTCIYTWIRYKGREGKVEGSAEWWKKGKQMAATTLYPSQQQEPGKVRSGLTNSLLSSGVSCFGQLAQSFPLS